MAAWDGVLKKDCQRGAAVAEAGRRGAHDLLAGTDCRRCAELSQQLAVARAERDAAQSQLAVLRKLLFGPKSEARQRSPRTQRRRRPRSAARGGVKRGRQTRAGCSARTC